VATYGEIAKLCGLVNQARMVGDVLCRTPQHLKVPWQRVINAQGKISFPKSSANYRRQEIQINNEVDNGEESHQEQRGMEKRANA
jgi:methylated-DNA-protein-cysteine methyltransferase-like protein